MLYAANSVVVIPEVLYTVVHDPNSITQVPRVKRAFDSLIVSERLYDFLQEEGLFGGPIGKIINDRIAICINNAFDIIIRNSPKDQKLFNKTFCDKHVFCESLKKASKLKYKIEAILFEMFPEHYVQIYKNMKILASLFSR